jgi:alpha-tubulin suppressor-like RCC1 family protein
VFGQDTDWTKPAAGDHHTRAVKTTGHLFCWGEDEFGQLGDFDDDEADAPDPIEVAPHPA